MFIPFLAIDGIVGAESQGTSQITLTIPPIVKEEPTETEPPESNADESGAWVKSVDKDGNVLYVLEPK